MLPPISHIFDTSRTPHGSAYMKGMPTIAHVISLFFFGFFAASYYFGDINSHYSLAFRHNALPTTIASRLLGLHH